MNKLYVKLAITNIKKNKLLYIPYIISGIVVISFVYMMSFMKLNKGIDTVYGAETVKAMMSLGLWIVLIFSYIFLFYTNSFLLISEAGHAVVIDPAEGYDTGTIPNLIAANVRMALADERYAASLREVLGDVLA